MVDNKKFYKNIILGYSLMINLFLMGAVFNFVTMENNGNKMPVYSLERLHTIDNEHFQYYHPSQVNMSYLTDVYYFNDSIWSLGDIMMLIALASMMVWGVFIIGYAIYSLGETW